MEREIYSEDETNSIREEIDAQGEAGYAAPNSWAAAGYDPEDAIDWIANGVKTPEAARTLMAYDVEPRRASRRIHRGLRGFGWTGETLAELANLGHLPADPAGLGQEYLESMESQTEFYGSADRTESGVWVRDSQEEWVTSTQIWDDHEVHAQIGRVIVRRPGESYIVVCEHVPAVLVSDVRCQVGRSITDLPEGLDAESLVDEIIANDGYDVETANVLAVAGDHPAWGLDEIVDALEGRTG